MKIIKTTFVLLALILIITTSANAIENVNETNKTNTTDAQNKTEDEDEKPGFEAVFAIAGLIAVAYLIRRD